MAFTFIKEPLGIYPAYNNSFVEFSSDLLDNNRAEITASPISIFPKTFIIYPDSSGKYVFNIKEVAKAVLNVDGFKDSNFFDDAYYKSISGLYLLQSMTIEVFSDITSESVIKEYEFFKSVKQIGEEIFSNELQILSDSKNGVDYNLTYFEGFPFHFDLQRVGIGVDIKVKNVNSGIITQAMPATQTSAFRLNVDRSEGLNWTSDDFLPLIEGLNKLEIYEDDVFRTNLNLKKKKICNGVYLKWANSDGGFGHFLFQEYFREGIKGKTIAYIGSNEFLNVGELSTRVQSTGKAASGTIRVKAKLDKNEIETIKSLFLSPFIQVYTSRSENVKGEFINVDIIGNLDYKNKVSNNEVDISILLPEFITAKL